MALFGRFIDAGPSLRGLCLAGICMACSVGAGADESNSTASPTARQPLAPVHEPVVANPMLDRSGDKRRGKASFYARMFAGRKMADGTPMLPQSNSAASKTLPLGTTAKVTNLETGQSAVVPFATGGRISEAASWTYRPPRRNKSASTTKRGLRESRSLQS